ncbi:MAG: tyrosine transporter, partial [Chlamydiia bacterium]|nr:tyrosine transporter [Chlamydiia bacterium]
MTDKYQKFIPGSLFGGMLLVAGCCIGAGMLALPILIGLTGFFPSLLILFAAWGFMTYTGCLLIEIHGWFSTPVNLLSMVKEGLGKTSYGVAWVTYLLLFYSLLVAYVAGGGAIFSAIGEALFHIHVPEQVASLVFTLFLGWVIYLGTQAVDWVNRFLMIGLVFAYVSL